MESTNLKVNAHHIGPFSLVSVFNAASEGMLGIDQVGKHVFVNQSAAKMLGYSPEELVGTDSHSAWHAWRPDGSVYPKDECPLHRSLKKGEPTNGRDYFVRKDGSFIPVEFNCRPVSENGKVSGAVITFVDITERQKQEKELHILRTAIEQSPVTTVITGLGGTIEYVNPQFERTSGYSQEEALGANPRILKAGDLPEAEYTRLWETITAGKNWHGRFHNKKKNGELYWEEAMISPVTGPDGRIAHFLALKQDVTERLRLEEQLAFQLRFKRAIAEISSALAQVSPETCNRVINDALERLGTIFNADRAFLFRVSEDYTYIDTINEWCVPGVCSQKERYAHFLISDIPWWSRILERGEVFHVPDVETLPPEAENEKAHLKAGKVLSCLYLPMKRGDGRITGFIGLEMLGRHYAWSADAIRMFTIVVETIGGALERADTSSRLRENEMRLRTVLESMTDVVWSLRYPDLEPLFLSPSVEQLYGHPREAFLSDPDLWQRIIHPDDRHTSAVAMKQIEQSGHGERECRIIRPDGEIRWIIDRSHMVRDDSGAPVRIDGIVTDITKRKHAEDEIRYQNAFQEMITEVATRFISARSANIEILLSSALERIGTFLAVDRASIVQLVEINATASTTHEWYRKELVPQGESPVQNFPVEKAAWLKQKILVEHSVVDIPDTALLPPEAEAERHILQSLGITSGLMVPIRTETRTYGLVGVYTIGRSRKWTESTVRGLSLIVQILANAFAAIDAENALIAMKEEYLHAKETAEAANRAKSDFLSSMSHELRTPLNAVLGFAQILEIDDTLSEEHVDSVREIIHAGFHLLNLVNEVLDLSRIESGRIDLSLEPVSCREIIDQAVSLITPLADSYNVTLQPPDSAACTIQADRTRIKQVLVNVLSNAIKYNRPGGRVEIRVEPHEEVVRIVVMDTGTGIAPERMDELFIQFSRLGRERGDIDGTGIGLALTRRLVELMHGSIWAESTVGVGSTFFVELPKAAKQAEDSSSNTGAPERAHSRYSKTSLQVAPGHTDGRPTVLYIEDNPSGIRLVEHIFTRRPELRLLTAQAGSVGIDLAEVHHPACILLDINMPDMNGFEVLRRIKGSDWGLDIPVIAISANAMDESIQRGKDAGFDGYIIKPINIADFLRVVDQAITGDGS
jgi:PAS domain S-box-containing protein